MDLHKPDKVTRLLQVIINEGKLSDYEEIIQRVIDGILQHGFTISTRCDNTQSVTKWCPNKHVQLSLKKEPLQILWDLFHEFGHVLSGEKCAGDKITDYEREIAAWDNAFLEISKQAILLSKEEVFFKCRAACLKTYDTNITTDRTDSST